MRAIGDFTPINQPETDIFAFDFTSVLLAGETITGMAPDANTAWTIGVETGTDATPESHKVGPSQLQGNLIVQKVGGLIAGVVYWFSGAVLTSNGRTLLLWAACDCGVIGC